MKSTTSSSPRLPQRISLVSLTAQRLRESMQAGHWHGHLPGERELCARLQDAIVQQLSQANGENVSLGSISI